MNVLFGYHVGNPKAEYFYLYHTGGVHGIYNYSDLNEFKRQFSQCLEYLNLTFDPSDYDMVTITNNAQQVSREYLKELGFTSYPFGNLLIHFGTVSMFSVEKEKTNAEGRVLNKDESIRRKPFEYFVGDRIKFTSNSGEEKIGRVRQVFDDEAGPSRRYKTRLHTIAAHQIIELVERSQ